MGTANLFNAKDAKKATLMGTAKGQGFTAEGNGTRKRRTANRFNSKDAKIAKKETVMGTAKGKALPQS